MASTLCLVDDKHVPLAYIVWVSDVPHFCGQDDCQCEGRYEIRLENGESVWGNQADRDQVLEALEQWYAGPNTDEF